MSYHPTTKRPRFKFFGNIIAELKKVTWLSRREAIYLTFLVLLVTVAVGLILGAFDYGFTHLVDKIFLGQ
jgi:preprotein translocase subunit SecE